MAYYNVDGRKIDIHCNSADTWERGCSGQCESCPHCEVEDLKTGGKFPYVGSEYDH